MPEAIKIFLGIKILFASVKIANASGVAVWVRDAQDFKPYVGWWFSHGDLDYLQVSEYSI